MLDEIKKYVQETADKVEKAAKRKKYPKLARELKILKTIAEDAKSAHARADATAKKVLPLDKYFEGVLHFKEERFPAGPATKAYVILHDRSDLCTIVMPAKAPPGLGDDFPGEIAWRFIKALAETGTPELVPIINAMLKVDGVKFRKEAEEGNDILMKTVVSSELNPIDKITYSENGAGEKRKRKK